MRKKSWNKLLAVMIAFAVAFGVTAQMGTAAFATDTPAAPTQDAVPVTVTYDANGGKAVAPATVAAGAAIGALPSATRAKYSLVGWFTAKSGGTQVTADTVVTAPVTYYAHWTLTQKTLTLNANKGNIKGAPTKAVTVKYGKIYGSKLTTPKRTGYTFMGWYTAKSGGTLVTKDSIVTNTKAKQTLYAQWTAKILTVTFDANGGTVGTDTSVVTTQTYNKRYALPDAPVRTGYTFVGWYTAKSGGSMITASAKVAITKNKTFYARWMKTVTPTLVYQTTMQLTGSGSGWHGKIVIQDGNTGISFGIQHDNHSALGFSGKDALMFESVRNNPGYHYYKAFKAVDPGWHVIRLEYYKSQNIAKGYCDGEYIGQVPTQSLGSSLLLTWEAVPRLSGDTVDASFKDTFVDSTAYGYGGTNDAWQSAGGSFSHKKIGQFVDVPNTHAYFDNGTGWRIWGTANIPGGGDWDSYPSVGGRVLMTWFKK